MIFTGNKELSINGVKKLNKIIIGLLDTGRQDREDKMYKGVDLATNSEMLTYFESKGNRISFTVEDGGKVPIPIFNNGNLDVTAMFKIIENQLGKTGAQEIEGNLRENIINKLSPQFEALGDAKMIVSGLIEGCESMYHYLRCSKIDSYVSIPSHMFDSEVYGTLNDLIINSNNNVDNPFSTITLEDNKTLFQDNCESRFFIKLPVERDFVGEDDIDLLSFIPDRNSVVVPYTNAKAYTYKYKEPGNCSSAEIPYIEGFTKNNYLAIQDNEKDFYDALCDWICYNSKKEYGVEVADKDVVIDPFTESYLKTLVESIYSWHWGHNPGVPYRNVNKKTDDDESSDDDDAADDSGDSSYEFRVDENVDAAKLLNALEVIKQFISDAYNKLGYRVYAEAIVKLARWGDRKPQVLYIEGYDYVYELGTTIIRPYLGNVEDYTVVTFNGAELKAICMIYEDVNVTASLKKSTTNRIAFPVGVMLKQVLNNKNKPDEKNIECMYYVHMIDIVRRLKSGELIDGLALEDGKIVVDDSKVIDDTEVTYTLLRNNYVNDMNKFLVDPFYRSEELKGVYLELNTYENGKSGQAQNLFGIFYSKCQNPNMYKDAEQHQFNSKSQLVQMLKEWKIISKEQAIDYCVLLEIMPLYEDMIVRWKDTMSLTETIQLWDTVITENKFINEAQFLRDSLFNGSAGQGSQKSMDSMNAFGEDEEEDVNIIREIGKDEELATLLSENKEAIGGYAKFTKVINGKEVPCFVVISRESIAKGNFEVNPRKGMGIDKFRSLAVNNLILIHSKRSDDMRLYFHDLESAMAFSAM